MQQDLLGFQLPNLSTEQQKKRAEDAAQAQTYAKEWEAMAASRRLPSQSKLKKMIRKGGIPHKHRTWAWNELAGVRQLKASKPDGYFAQLLSQGQMESKCLHQIELDLPRTYPEHAWLHGPDGQAALRAVLIAYSMHDAQGGYCQGLNFVTGTLLLATNKEPETAFWLLVALVDRILYRNMYGSYLPGFMVEMKGLNKLVKKKMPALYKHFEELDCEMMLLATDWFLCLFVKTLPHEVALRVLDCLFCEGSKVLYRTSLAILKIHKAELMQQTNAGEVLQCMKGFIQSWWSAKDLLKISFNRIGSLPMARILKYRSRFQPEVDEMVRKREENVKRQEQAEAERLAAKAAAEAARAEAEAEAARAEAEAEAEAVAAHQAVADGGAGLQLEVRGQA